MSATKDMDIENVLKKFNLRSPYYIKLLSLLLFAGSLNAMHCVQYVFIISDVKYRCNEPYFENNTYDDRCHRIDKETNKSVKCTEWKYEDPNAFFSEFNLACQDWKRLFVATVHCFGYMIGLLIIGPLADKFGRKFLIITTGLVAAFMGLGRSVVYSYWLYIVLELIEAMFGDPYSTTYMLGVEMVTKENRVTFIAIMTAVTSLAGILMAVIAWAVPYWRTFLLVIYTPALFILLYPFLLDESLRWLLITGRKEKAENIIKSAAKMDNINISEVCSENIYCEKAPKVNISMAKIFKITFSSRTLLLRFAACVCMWTTGLFSKYTLLMNSVELEGNKYLNFGLMKFCELPASVVLCLVLKRFERKKPLIFSFLLTGVFCVSQSFMPKDEIMLTTSLFLLGKFMATISYEIIYLYTSELFPTYLRNTMHSLCSSLGRTAAMLATQTPLLATYWYGLPSLLIGLSSTLTGVIVIMMPDTADDILPDTVKDAENIGHKGNNNKIENTSI
ncbi:unnamed protein product [Arctia plantaginis]|uniref:Major facilitator superfamily (MFS) profile domain-containing protein n=1 Tax=Arctia plantaginis TaxID=874455 RepID=A0A8S1A559_ARCPL|nr:unnamed protein product [Arctia plantaginis]